MSFSEKIISWYTKSGRILPWRTTKDPYIIWLSEIILQQTRVEQGLPYFHSFVTKYPNVQKFADAEEGDILRLWQGLGYYSRARNMHRAAKRVIAEFQGNFPTRYADVIQLPGIGDYTAAAISSFSINEKQAVLDGNVFRVLARCFGIDLPINSGEGKKVFKNLAQELISDSVPGLHNQAIMDFGAIQCKPKMPLCETCIFRLECVAFNENRVFELPVKTKGKVSRNRFFHYFLHEKENAILMSKRGEADVWANLYELPLIETENEVDVAELMLHHEFIRHFDGAELLPINGQIKHVLSHQNIYARFYRLENLPAVKEKKADWNYCLSENLNNLAKHKLIFSFLNKYIS
ncbi:A/G-specific adenine glycosylase [Sphingobacterium alkalisoli]|uniref:Adenine DNA glycosylase n=1 Tax=Sphingobacterium alkalisoli TaxID=1874115 RepID=A0A4U0H8X7_9SPHI|nr:A/G-specific adenine glycosylase [Sphingobacterium alkalisoli]TJY68226.1 A/G-specific adenine glycosylase [Sphingobacterium alkalisoli]GGH08067.1 A/G-specific adenine glycosylase [Sphingobacterium alkalisoli]